MSELHIVFGGELIDTASVHFKNPGEIHVVGIFLEYSQAEAAWRSAAQKTVDSALTRYFIADLSKLHIPD